LVVALVFINGVPGTGKSAVCDELKRRGYLARDTDGDGFSAWRNKVTGEYVTEHHDVEHRDQAFLDAHDWITDIDKVAALAEQARTEGRTAYLFGSSSNEHEIWNVADQVYCLAVDDDTLRNRLLTRTNNDYGKSDIELQWCLEWNKVVPRQSESVGATVIDATPPVAHVADKLLRLSGTV
jgi:broad-specificity NMP kinase